MSLEQKLEKNFHRTQKKMKELTIEMERLEREYQQMLKEFGLSSEQLKEFAENSENFSPPIWEQLQKEKKQLDEKLDLSLNNIRDPAKAKKALSEKGTVQPHWIF